MNTFKLYRRIGLPAEFKRREPFRFVARLLFSVVRLERRGTTLNLSLATRPPDTETPVTVDKASTEALTVRAALKTLLDSHPMTRRVMRHLAFFERALAVQGLEALAELPVEVLSSAVEQLEVLVSNWSNPHLAELRSKMALAVVDRTRDPFYGRTGDKLSSFNTDSRLLVGDASHSMFLELERQYQNVLPAQSIQAALERVRGGVTKTTGITVRIATDRVPTLHREFRA